MKSERERLLGRNPLTARLREQLRGELCEQFPVYDKTEISTEDEVLVSLFEEFLAAGVVELDSSSGKYEKYRLTTAGRKLIERQQGNYKQKDAVEAANGKDMFRIRRLLFERFKDCELVSRSLVDERGWRPLFNELCEVGFVSLGYEDPHKPFAAFILTQSGKDVVNEFRRKVQSGETLIDTCEHGRRYEVYCSRCEEEHSPPKDAVNHPSHYGGSEDPYEAIKVIEAWGLGFCLGNTLKYIRRNDAKGSPLEDLRKARWYLDREIKRLEREG
jgi:hypothetical protein